MLRVYTEFLGQDTNTKMFLLSLKRLSQYHALRKLEVGKLEIEAN